MYPSLRLFPEIREFISIISGKIVSKLLPYVYGGDLLKINFLGELLNELSHYCGERGINESAIDTLKRIIKERNIMLEYFCEEWQRKYLFKK